jgi:hypothetical protein
MYTLQGSQACISEIYKFRGKSVNDKMLKSHLKITFFFVIVATCVLNPITESVLLYVGHSAVAYSSQPRH